MLLKTTAEAADALAAFLADRHPYATPCIIALPVDRSGSYGDFLAWVEEEVIAPAMETVTDEPVSPER
jgi:uncharacterized protein involved in tolerance to divalent cations